MKAGATSFTPTEFPRGARIAIVAARFNGDIVEKLLANCRRRLGELGIDESRIQTQRVPGAFELPVAAKVLAETGKFAAVICLGCVIRGETAHFEYVAGEAARGIQQVAIETKLPVVFGVLTTETQQQAIDRLDAGDRAAEAAIEMIATLSRIRGQG
jgi:6,7-dimethyl-8-ribityllumazine synthase